LWFGQCFEDYTSSPHRRATFFYGKSDLFFFTKMGLATFWAIFSTNSYSHPGKAIGVMGEAG
jgi:hypothetical protein